MDHGLEMTSLWSKSTLFTRCKHATRVESHTRPTETAGHSVTHPHGVSSRCNLERDGMIIPTAAQHGQMGPGGGWNFRSPPVQYVGGQKPLSLEEAGHFLASAGLGLALGGLRTGGSFVSGLLHWRMHHAESDQSSIWFRLDDAVNSPPGGGGGPAGIPNLHRPPPSIEETGEILSNPSIMGEITNSSTSKGRSTGRCPYHWRYRGHKDRRGWDRGYWTLHYPRGPRCVLRKGHSGPHRK